MKKIIKLLSLIFISMATTVLFIKNLNTIKIHADIPETYYSSKELHKLGFYKNNGFPKKYWGTWYNASKSPMGGNIKKTPIDISKIKITKHSINDNGYVYKTSNKKNYLRILNRYVTAKSFIKNKLRNIKQLPIYEGKDSGLSFISSNGHVVGISVVLPPMKKNSLPNRTTMTMWYHKTLTDAKKYYQINN